MKRPQERCASGGRLLDGWAFLERERREMAPHLYAQEYEAEFGRGGGSLFSLDQIESMFRETAGRSR